jgi:hypothetical protein
VPSAARELRLSARSGSLSLAMSDPGDAAFVSVDVDPCAAAPEGLGLRFKRAGAPRAVARVWCEPDEGPEGFWRVCALDADDREGEASVTPVEDSSEGTVLLVAGGAHGLSLAHEQTGQRVAAPYLLLSLRSPTE